jgi:hypothetical protein
VRGVVYLKAVIAEIVVAAVVVQATGTILKAFTKYLNNIPGRIQK